MNHAPCRVTFSALLLLPALACQTEINLPNCQVDLEDPSLGVKEALVDFKNGYPLALKDVEFANLKIANCELRKASLRKRNVSNADLTRCDLRKALLSETNFTCAFLVETNLAGANLYKSTLDGAKLDRADLTNANLAWASLRGTRLVGTMLGGADFTGADLSGAYFEPAVFPEVRLIAGAKGLEQLRYQQPYAIAQLREEFRNNGFLSQERKLTFSLNRVESFTRIRDILRYFFFELTTDWGMSPSKPIKFLLYILGGGTIFYCLQILTQDTSPDNHDKRGIYKRQTIGSPDRVIVRDESPNYLTRKDAWLLHGAFFSIVSSFYFGWGDFRFSSWLMRLNPENFRLGADGWTRTISAIQSLLSLYLLVLFFLTYFGRPFG